MIKARSNLLKTRCERFSNFFERVLKTHLSLRMRLKIRLQRFIVLYKLLT